jgi:peroxiredoxin
MENLMPLRAEAHVPEVVFKIRVGDGPLCGDGGGHWQDLSSKEVFSGKKVIVIGLPGAYTPICSVSHLPGYENFYKDFKAHGIDEVYCVSVNDAFVMHHWAASLHVEMVKMLPDGNTAFTRGMGMIVKKENLGFGERSWRYSMLVVDGIIKKIFVEPGISDNCPIDPFEVSGADTMLDYLKKL